MSKKITTKTNKSSLFIFILCGVFIAAGYVTITLWFQHQLNPDATSYFTIAKKYADGDLRHAINGYWGPLYSWLLVPFVWLGANLIVAAKMINVAAAAIILISVYFFLKSQNVRPTIANVICLISAPILFSWATIDTITPDMLFALWTWLFSITLLLFLRTPTARRAMLLGLTGALMYFTKSIGLPLFVCVLLIAAAYQWYRIRPSINSILKLYSPVFITLACLVLPFIALISLKYGHPTISTAAAYNFSIVGPDLQWHQALGSGVYNPPNSTAISPWEDPTAMTAYLPAWSPFESRDHFKYYFISIIGKNLVTFVESLYIFGPIVVGGMLVYILGMFGSSSRKQFGVFTAISATLIMAYTSLALEGRYIWVVAVFAAVSIGIFTQRLYERKVITHQQVVLAGVLIFALSSVHLGVNLNNSKNIDKPTYQAAVALKKYIPIGSHIATDDFNSAIFACWNDGYICHGTLSPPTGDQTAYLQSLRTAGISYYVVYGANDTQKQFTDAYAVRIPTNIKVVIYKIK